MSRIRTLVVDDEPLIRERISDLVRESAELDLVGEARNGLEALDMISTLEPELAFMDIEMPELSGLGVVAELDADKAPIVVFVTAYEQYAVKAFEVGAVDYLHKPVSRQRFNAAVSRARERIDSRSASAFASIIAAARNERSRVSRARFVVRKGNAHYFVPVVDIEWIDAADNYLRLHCGPRVHFYRGTMKEAEEELDPARFVRIHRSLIVAVDRIAAIRTNASGGRIVELQNGLELRSSRQYVDRVNKLLS